MHAPSSCFSHDGTYFDGFKRKLGCSAAAVLFICIIPQITIGYALIAVINGVFLKETFSAADNDDKIMMRNSLLEVAAPTLNL